MPRYLTLILAAVFFIILLAGEAFAGGLSSTFVEEKIENLEPGKSCSVKESVKRPLVVTNTTEDMTVDIEITPEKPVDYNLVPGYEPIPDLSWIKIEKSYFEKVEPGQSIKTDITITIPDEPQYYSRKYQLYIYSHTAGQGMFRIGIMSRLLFTTSQK